MSLTRKFFCMLAQNPYERHCVEYAMWIEDDPWRWEYKLIHGEPE